MLKVTKFIPQGRGLATVLLKRAATVELGRPQCQQASFQATDSVGRELDVALPPGSTLRGGDVLLAEDGSLVQVVGDALDSGHPATAATETQGHGHHGHDHDHDHAHNHGHGHGHVHGPGCKHDH